jgi:hypothetical protein
VFVMIIKCWRKPALLGLGVAAAAAVLAGAVQLTGSTPAAGSGSSRVPARPAAAAAAAPVRPATRAPAAKTRVGEFAGPVGGGGSAGDDSGWQSVGIFSTYQECWAYFVQNYNGRIGEIEDWSCEQQPNGSYVLKIKWYPRNDPEPAPPTDLPQPDPVLPPVTGPQPGCDVVPLPGIGPAPLPCLPFGS